MRWCGSPVRVPFRRRTSCSTGRSVGSAGGRIRGPWGLAGMAQRGGVVSGAPVSAQVTAGPLSLARKMVCAIIR